MSWISDCHEGCIIAIRAAPRASRNQIQGLYGDTLKIRLKAPPVDGKANKELVAFMAECMGIPTQQLELLTGDHGRLKRILVRNRTALSVREQLNKYVAPGN